MIQPKSVELKKFIAKQNSAYISVSVSFGENLKNLNGSASFSVLYKAEIETTSAA